jgi:peptidylprolyl isomerase
LFVKLIGLFCLFLIALAFAACGGGSADPQGDIVVWKKGKPAVIAHHGPLPKKLIAKDLRPGSGAVLTKGRTATLRYRNFEYRTGRRFEDWWERPFVTEFGKGESLGAWETGLKGMRVGGRRELIVPAKEAYAHVAQIYVLELISVH